jgi:pilus assembly protein Flp/PilA
MPTERRFKEDVTFRNNGQWKHCSYQPKIRRVAMKKLIAFFKDEEGATAVEYAIMVGLIAAVIIVAVTAIGTNANQTFTDVAAVIPAGS